MAKTTCPPKYRRQKTKSGDRAFVQLDGHKVYLGEFGSKVSKEQYARVLAEHASGGGLALDPDDATTISELVASFWVHAEKHYRRPDGTPTNEISTLRYALRPLIELYGSVTVTEFGPRSLKAVQQRMVAAGWCRTSINKNISRIRSVFKWGVASEIVPPSILNGLQALRGLLQGRCDAKENPPKRPVPDTDIEAVRERVSSPVKALIDLQLLTGARSGELVGLRAVDIDTSKPVWSCTLDQHKTSHHGRERVLHFGPRSQAVLQPFLSDRPVDAFLFSPIEGVRELNDRAPTHRRENQLPNERTTDRKVTECYTTASYRRAIERACKAAKIPTWSPHRLRHNAGTRLRKEFGIETARAALGHTSAAVTEIYAELDFNKVADVMAKVG